MSENSQNPQVKAKRPFYKMKRFIIPIIVLFIIISSNIGKKDLNTKTNHKENSQSSNQQNQNFSPIQSVKSKNDNMMSEISKSNNTQLTTKTTIEYLKTKKEKSGNLYDEIFLYSVGDKPNFEEIKKFCITQKSTFKDGSFHVLMFFDKKENADFPSYPISAVPGLDEKNLIHIKAYYTFNFQNGYSMLSTYEENAWTSKVVDFKI